jgi:hypothetical protein
MLLQDVVDLLVVLDMLLVPLLVDVHATLQQEVGLFSLVT